MGFKESSDTNTSENDANRLHRHHQQHQTMGMLECMRVGLGFRI